jgi:enolase
MSRGAGSRSAGKITRIQALEVLDSRGNPTVQTTVWAGETSATASVPSGASTGVHEALELRDGDKKRYGGKGVLKACRNVEEKIFKAVKGISAGDQEKIDQTMIDLDGTDNKAKLGANAILSVSLASARLAAKCQKMELYEYLREVYLSDDKTPTLTLPQGGRETYSLPTPLFNVINGGAHADSGLDIQEYFIIPQKGNFATKLRMGAEVYHALKAHLAAKGLTVAVGDEGGFAPKLKSNEEPFKYLENAMKTAGYKFGVDFRMGVDVASSEFYDKKSGQYVMKASKEKFSSAAMWKFYKKWLDKYHLEILEDACEQDDFLGWKLLMQNLGTATTVVGDDLFCTNINRLHLGVQQSLANGIIIKVNQIGTLTETLKTIKLAQKNKYKIVISHRSGETSDNFIADLAVAVNADYIKSGAPCRGERLAKYNRLLEIENRINE